MTAQAIEDGAKTDGRRRRLLEEPPPHDLEAERALLGSLMLEPQRIPKVLGIVKPWHCYREAHRAVFAALLEAWNRGPASEPGRGVDVIAVRHEIARAGTGKLVAHSKGLAVTLADILMSVPHGANAVYYAQLVRDYWERRRVFQMGLKLMESARDLRRAPCELAKEAKDQLAKLVRKP